MRRPLKRAIRFKKIRIVRSGRSTAVCPDTFCLSISVWISGQLGLQVKVMNRSGFPKCPSSPGITAACVGALLRTKTAGRRVSQCSKRICCSQLHRRYHDIRQREAFYDCCVRISTGQPRPLHTDRQRIDERVATHPEITARVHVAFWSNLKSIRVKFARRNVLQLACNCAFVTCLVCPAKVAHRMDRRRHVSRTPSAIRPLYFR